MKIHIVSGFLGAGKTTFINKWLPLLKGKVCLIENEFGDISIDGNLFPQKLEIKEIYAGCICCSLVGDFRKGILELFESHAPDHLIIEPSGVGSLSDVIRVCEGLVAEQPMDMSIGNIYTIVDVTAFEDYIEHFGEFYTNQVSTAPVILLSYINEASVEGVNKVVGTINKINPNAYIVSEEWTTLDEQTFESYLSLGSDRGQVRVRDKGSVPANELIESYSLSSPRTMSLERFLHLFEEMPELANGQLIRAKGFLCLTTKEHIHFNYTPFHKEWSYTEGDVKPALAFIGTEIDKNRIKKSFSKQFVIKGGSREMKT